MAEDYRSKTIKLLVNKLHTDFIRDRESIKTFEEIEGKFKEYFKPLESHIDHGVVFDERIWLPIEPENYRKLILVWIKFKPVNEQGQIYFHLDRDQISFDGYNWFIPDEM